VVNGKDLKGINSRFRLFLGEDLIRSSGMVFGASLVGSVILLFSNLVLSKHFGPEGFGNYKTVVSLFLFLPALIEFGAGTTLTKYIAEFSDERINYLLRWFLKLRIALYLCLFGIIFTFRGQIAIYFLKDASMSYLVLPGLLFVFFVFFGIFGSITLGFQNFKLYSFSQFLTSASAGLLTVISGYLFGVYYAIIAYGAGYLIGNLPNIRFSLAKKVFGRGVRNDLDIKRIFFRYSLPIHLMVIPGLLSIGIIPILSLFFPQELIGYYAFAWIFYSGVVLIPTALSQVLLPKVSELSGTKDFEGARGKLVRAFIVYTPFVLLGVAGCLLFSEVFVGIIAPAYLSGLVVFEALVCFGLVVGYLLIYRGYLTGLARMKELTLLVVVQNVALLGVSFITVGGIG
jgi:O-antigen/teichoic acid export membrane protein